MARRAAERVGGALASEHEVGGAECDVDGGSCRLPGAGADQGHRVVGEAAGPRARRDGLACLEVAEQAEVGEQVRDHPVLARVLHQPGRLPLAPGGREIPGQRRVVKRERLAVGVVAGGDDAGATILERRPDPLRPLGHLGPGSPDAHPDFAAGLVEPVAIAPDDGQRKCHGPFLPERALWRRCRSGACAAGSLAACAH